MANLIAARQAQWPLVAEFTFNVADTMLNTSGVSDNFNTVAAHVFDVINLPQGAIVIGGEVVTENAVTGSTAYNVKVGDSGSDVRYLGTTDKTAAGSTSLVPTGYVGTGENLRLTVTPTVAASVLGTITVRVEFIIRGKANENVTN
jgi:hypothetical protein